jgi:hypothetical protein
VGRTLPPETGEFRSCASGSTCVLFAAMVSYSPAPDSGDLGPTFTVDLIRDGARSSVSYASGETVFGFGDVILPELSVAGASSVKLAIREQGAGADLVVVDLPEPSGKAFSLWLVGHPGASGAGAARVILCRDSEPEIDGLSDCTRITVP